MSGSASNIIHAEETFRERRQQPISVCVSAALERYFNDLNGEMPKGLYQTVLAEVEAPLLRSVMDFTRGNQSKASILLGINRSTLRKKLEKYDLCN